MNNNKILPIGTIVYLREGTEKVMILNRGAVLDKDGTTFLFDYSGSLYPVGLNPEQIFYFNQDNIDKVVFEGYTDEEEERFVDLYEEWLSNEGSSIPKGDVEKLSESENKSWGF
jgi:hypothetical protein